MMGRIYFTIVATLLLALLSTAASERTGAFLVFTRELDPGHIVEGRNVTVSYQVHNIGKGYVESPHMSHI